MRRFVTAGLLGLAVAGCGSSSSSTPAQSTPASGSSGSSTSAPPTARAPVGFEGVAVETGAAIGSAASTGTSRVDGISCAPVEQLAYHIHAHLTLFVAGAPRALPGGIGIPGSQVVESQEGPIAQGGHCIYWLHTHAPDGVIHIESPTARIYTLGSFFDEWRQPLSPTAVAGARGPVVAFVDGRRWPGSPRSIPLKPHARIQLDVGTPAPPFQPMTWPNNGL